MYLRSENTSDETYDAEVLQDLGIRCFMETDLLTSRLLSRFSGASSFIFSVRYGSTNRARDWGRRRISEVYVCDPTRPEHRCRPVQPVGAMGGR